MSSSGDCRFQPCEIHPYHIGSLPWAWDRIDKAWKQLILTKGEAQTKGFSKPQMRKLFWLQFLRNVYCLSIDRKAWAAITKEKGQVIRRKGRAGFSLLHPVSVKRSLAVLTGVSLVFSLRAPILCAPWELLTLFQNPSVVSSFQDVCSHRPRCESLNVVKACALIKSLMIVSLIILSVSTESFSNNSGFERNCKTMGQQIVHCGRKQEQW